MFLKQSTAATILVGPVLDSTGAAYTSMAVGDFNITKNGSTAAMASAATATHSHEGHYLIALTTGSTDTLGTLVISCNKSTYAMSKTERCVLSSAMYDWWYGTGTPITSGTGTAQLSVSIGQVTVATNNDKTGYSLSQAFPTNFSSLAITAGGAVTAGTVGDKTGYSISGTTTTLDALQTALNAAHGSGTWTTATGFATSSAQTSMQTDITSIKSVTTKLDTALMQDGLVYQFTVNALENGPGGDNAVSFMPVSGAATAGQITEGGTLVGYYGAPQVALNVVCTTTTNGTTSDVDLTSYDGNLAFIVFDNNDTVAVSGRIVSGSDITVSGNVATVSAAANHVLNTVVSNNLRWVLREDCPEPSRIFATGKYECRRAPLSQ